VITLFGRVATSTQPPSHYGSYAVTKKTNAEEISPGQRQLGEAVEQSLTIEFIHVLKAFIKVETAVFVCN
jgi:hypothetical protein